MRRTVGEGMLERIKIDFLSSVGRPSNIDKSHRTFNTL